MSQLKKGGANAEGYGNSILYHYVDFERKGRV